MALPRTRRQGGSPAVAEQWDPRTPHLGSPAPLWAGPGQGRPPSGGDEGPPGPPLTWASSALHTSCSLSGVMSTGTSNGEPSSCPPSSWNCTSSRCTSHAAASSCAHKGGGQSRRPTGKPPPPPPSGPGDPGPERPAALTHTHLRSSRRHPASPSGGERLRRDGAPPPRSRGPSARDIALWCGGGEVSRRVRPRVALGVPGTHLSSLLLDRWPSPHSVPPSAVQDANGLLSL